MPTRTLALSLIRPDPRPTLRIRNFSVDEFRLQTRAHTMMPYEVDLRFMKGEFVSAEGHHCHGGVRPHMTRRL